MSDDHTKDAERYTFGSAGIYQGLPRMEDLPPRPHGFDPARPLTIADVEALLRAYFGNDPHRQNVERETKRIYRALRNNDERLESFEKRLEALVASVGAHYGQYDSHRAIYGAQFDEFASTLRKADDRFLGLAERTETALESMKTVLKPFTPQYERAAPHAEPQGEAALRQEAAEARTVDDRADVIVRANKLRIEDAGPVGAGTDPPGKSISDVVLKTYERVVLADPRDLPVVTRVPTVELRAIVDELIRFRRYYGAWPVR
jgi:hypothetical protein